MRANRSARPARTADASRRRRPLTVRAVDSRGRVRLAVRVFNPAEAEIVTGMLELYLLHWPEPPAPAAVEARPGDSVGSVRVDSEE